MSLLTEIKAAQLAARKAKQGLRGVLLTTIIGEAEMVGKSAGNRESTDAEVLTVLKKFEKGANDTINFLQVAGTDNQDKIAMMENELSIIREFMPAKLTDDEVKAAINWIIGTQSLPLEQKSLGVITKMLKDKYGDRFDGKQASTIFKAMLQS